jgi:fumarate reductase (CoM/CoB) subunit A
MAAGDVRRERVDVLVVGGGLAAVQAAVSAAEAGAAVGVVTKRRMGRSGSSAMTSGGYAAVLDDRDDDRTALHVDDTLSGGGDIADPELVRILCDEGPVRVAELDRLGGAFRKADGRYVLSASGDHSRARSLGAEHHVGTDFTVPLADRALALGVRPFEFSMAVELLPGGDGVAGALVLDTREEAPYVIEAGATILATGGCGQLFPVTSNPKDVTGQGFSMGARAGAVLRDMEFVQFYPWRCIDPFTQSRVAIQPATFTVGGKMFNARGERFMAAYAPERLEATTRDVSARAIFDQVRRGLGVGGGVRLDLSALSDEVLAETNPKVAKGLKRSGIDHRTYPFVVAPEAHYAMGGLEIDAHARCSLARLYAAGEVAGGIQGANRLSNNALPEALVFGRRAGLDAAAVARDGERPRPDPDRLGAALDLVRTLRSRDGGAPLDRGAIQDVALRSLGIIRDGGALREGRQEVRRLAGRLRAAGPDAAGGLVEWFELRSLIEVAELCLAAASERTESRGAHHREDHPVRDDARWRGSLRLRRTPDGGLTTEFVPAAQQAMTSAG